MNKKYVIYSVLTIFLMSAKPSFSMGGRFFKFARLIGVATLPILGLEDACKKNNDLQLKLEFERTPVRYEEVNNWFAEQKKLVNISDEESVRLVKGDSWKSCGNVKNGYVSISPRTAEELNDALLNKINPDHDYLKRNSQKIIAQYSMGLRHEFGHIVHNDVPKRPYAIVLIPIVTEILSLGATLSVNKLLKRNMPKSLMGSFIRSGFAIGSLIPKQIINHQILLSWWKDQETEADKFACEHAQSPLELEEFANLLRTGIDDHWHPLLNNRIRMVDNYRRGWDTKHESNR